jgi:UDP-galactose transporter B1
MFLLWAIAQERLSVPFESLHDGTFEKFRSALFMGTCQSAMSSLSALVYILLRRKPNETLLEILGLGPGVGASRGDQVNGNGHTHKISKPHYSKRSLLVRYLQCAIFITSAAPFGFAALSYISYPAMVLGKSCKLVPVMIMNIVLYRRRFAPHKYLVVLMVTTGITIFMGFGKEGPSKAKGHSTTIQTSSAYTNAIGILYLLINLLLDGATNSTQDEIFTRHKVTGQQMMFWINLLCTCLTSILSILPLPYIPVIHPSHDGTELSVALTFIRSHPAVLVPLAQFALTGALGQLFIFEILQHFGSLTLVTVTLTRKLFTMLLSVIVYKHSLRPGQWFGAAVVFAGISVEAFIKRKDVHAKRVLQEKEKAKIKSL